MKSKVSRIPFVKGPTNLCTAAISGLLKFHDGSIGVWRAHISPSTVAGFCVLSMRS